VHTVVRLWELPILLLALDAQVLLAQEESLEHAKSNPVMQNAEFNIQKRDTTQTPVKTTQRPLPKFDLPEFVITGTASIDLPKVEKIILDDSIVIPHTMFLSSEHVLRDRETLELNIKNRERESQGQASTYTGFATAGIGTYFSPQTEIQFGQSFPEFNYSLGGNYFLTKGYAPNTDYSGGGVTASGGSTLLTTMPGLRNAALHGDIGYQSESYRFYGSATPSLQRTLSDFQFQVGVENKIANYLPCAAGISLASFNIADSSASIYETRFDLNYETSIPVSSLPVLSKFHFMMATGGLRYLDISAGAQNYWETGVLVEGSFHLYWVKGMAEQNLVHLCPQIMASYQITSQHLFYISYEQMFIPMTLASNIIANRYLSAASIIKHQYNTGMGELGVESHWTEEVQSRVSLNVKSARDLPMFSDSSIQGLWTLAYGGQTRIVTFCAEMVAKLNSNDYFASNVLLRSTNDSFLGGKIPYTPAVEAWCSATHRFGTVIAVRTDVRFAGERTTDLAGTAVLSSYAVADVRSEYTPYDFLRLTVGITNVTNTKFETWRGYREFPLTMHVAAHIKW
jgi:TonB dependent receptor